MSERNYWEAIEAGRLIGANEGDEKIVWKLEEAGEMRG